MKSNIGPEEFFFRSNDAFTPMPGLKIGATDSAHKVFYARDGDCSIAVKPYKGDFSARKAHHEFEMLQRVRSLGFLTLSPLRVIEVPNKQLTYLITHYQDDLTPMSAVVQNRHPSVSELVSQTAATLGDLHASSGVEGGISHGDAQAKNFAVMPDESSIAVFDFEKGGTDASGHNKNDPYGHDLESLVQSLAYKGFGGPHGPTASDKIYDTVILPYTDHARSGLGQDADTIGLKALDTFAAKHEELNNRHRKIA